MAVRIRRLYCTTVHTFSSAASRRPDCSPAMTIICSVCGTHHAIASASMPPFCTTLRQSASVNASGSFGLRPSCDARNSSSSRILSNGKPFASIFAILR